MKFTLNNGTTLVNIKVYDSLNTNYCRILGCDVITCSLVPISLDTAVIVSRFITSDFKMLCPQSSRISFLAFHSCNFFENKLQPNWLQSNLPIDDLSFRDCFLNEINDDAFSKPIFFNLRSLSIRNNNISSLRREMFKKMNNLRSILIHDNIVHEAHSNLLQDVSGTLEVLELDRSIKNVEVLTNITGHDSLLNVQILSLQGNSIDVLTANIFKGVGNLRSLYIDKSNLKQISTNAFQPFAQTISQLFLRNNKIRTLPTELLDPILDRPNFDFRLVISKNPWHCDCNLVWLLQLMKRYPEIIIDDLICQTPENVAGISLTEAIFCSTDTTTEESGTQIPENIVNISCKSIYSTSRQMISRQILSLPDYRFRSKLQDFYVEELDNGSVLVNLAHMQTTVTLLWFDNNELKSASTKVEEESVIHCLKDVGNSLILQNLKHDVTYTVCLLYDLEKVLSPFNCLALSTSSDYESRLWLCNGDKTVVITLLVILSFLLCLCGGFLMFILIRQNPALLRGSKRVIIVRYRKINAIVLPQSIRLDSSSQSLKMSQEVDYITPLENQVFPNARKDSEMSRGSSQSSDTSYISGIEPNLLQLVSWRISRTKKDDVPPPIPPRPSRAHIPSLSKTVESRMDFK